MAVKKTLAQIRQAVHVANAFGRVTEALITLIKTEVTGVESVFVFSSGVDNYEAVIDGGADADIGNLLWACSEAGIIFTGTASVVVEGETVYFTRPVPVAVDVEVTIAPYGGEQLPTNYEALITAAIQGYAATLKIGQGILIDTWKGLVYSACSGIDTVTIRQKKGSGDWQTDDIAMAYNERPVNPVDVTVILA